MKQLTALFLVFILIGACQKYGKDTPRSIKQEIRKRKNYCLKDVTEYYYKGEYVYLFGNNNCSDGESPVLNSKGETICSFGGYSGSGDGKCLDFGKEATNPRLIWERK